MARKLRVEYPGAIYHVMNRGDRQEPIFIDEKDREMFLKTLGVGRLAGTPASVITIDDGGKKDFLWLEPE
jgi:hypothetical protein